MRNLTPVLLLAVAACSDAEPEEYVIIDDFLRRSTTLECVALPGAVEFAVTEMHAATDSTVLVLDGPGRSLLELDPALRVVWAFQAPAAGPGALEAPVDAVALGDTAVVVAERRGLRLIVFRRDGELIRSTPLPFVPHSLAAGSSGDVLLTAMPMGGRPPSLLFRYDGEELHEVPVPPRSYADMMVGAIGNSALVDVLDGGDALLVHQFLSPRAFRVGVAGGIEPLRVPTPDATRAQLPYVPVAPITDDQLPLMLVPSMAMTVDRSKSEVYLLTRSGRMRGENAERAVLRLDDRLRLLDSYIINVVARGIAFLPRTGTALVVDDEDRFHACHLPATSHRHARAD
jgi:hypothetical protein